MSPDRLNKGVVWLEAFLAAGGLSGCVFVLSFALATASEGETLVDVILPVLLAALLASFGYRRAVDSFRAATGRPPIVKWLTPSPAFFLRMLFFAGILSIPAIAITKFAELVRKGAEGASKGSIGAIRSALSIYYGDLGGQYPSELPSLTVGGKYISAIPPAKAPNYHADSTSVRYGMISDDAGGWLYNNVPGDLNIGWIMLNCTHTDTKNSVWTSY